VREIEVGLLGMRFKGHRERKEGKLLTDGAMIGREDSNDAPIVRFKILPVCRKDRCLFCRSRDPVFLSDRLCLRHSSSKSRKTPGA
jgi:hypothetical protein